MSGDSQLLGYMERAIAELEVCVHALGRHYKAPSLVKQGERPVFRYEATDDVLLSMLKCVRSVGVLNAAVVLLRAGYVLEVYALCRIVGEAEQDVTFMALPSDKDEKLAEDQRRFYDEFFQEEFEDESKVLDSQKGRDRISRQRIRSAIANLEGHPGNPHDVIAIDRTLYQVFSGYVHGAYVHIMESFGGVAPGHFHTRGMLGTPKIQECEEQLVNYIFRAICSAEIVALRLKDEGVRERLRGLRKEFGVTTGCVPKDAKDARETLSRAKGKPA